MRLSPVLLAPVLALGLAACSQTPAPATPQVSLKPAQMVVEYPWTRTTDESRRPDMVGSFMSLSNPGDKEIRMTGCASDVAATCQIHEMVRGADGVMMMQEAKGGVAVPAGGHLHLEPGGYHVMLMDLRKKLPVGEEVTLTVTFDDGTTQTVKSPVKKFTEETEHYHAGMTPSPSATPSA